MSSESVSGRGSEATTYTCTECVYIVRCPSRPDMAEKIATDHELYTGHKVETDD